MGMPILILMSAAASPAPLASVRTAGDTDATYRLAAEAMVAYRAEVAADPLGPTFDLGKRASEGRVAEHRAWLEGLRALAVAP